MHTVAFHLFGKTKNINTLVHLISYTLWNTFESNKSIKITKKLLLYTEARILDQLKWKETWQSQENDPNRSFGLDCKKKILSDIVL